MTPDPIEGDIHVTAKNATMAAADAPAASGGSLVEDTTRVGTGDGSIEVRPAGDGLVEDATDPKERKETED